LQFQTIDIWHSDVGDQAVRCCKSVRLPERLTGRKDSSGVSCGIEQAFERLQNPIVVIHQRAVKLATVLFGLTTFPIC
jgi:hypothetical protein